MNTTPKTAQIITTQNYMLKFQCIGGQCENDCCHGWAIQISKVFYDFLKQLSKKNFRDRKRFKRIKIKPEGHELSYAHMELNKNESCPYMNPDGLCDIHLRYGHKKLGIPCKDYPRIVRSVANALELSGTLSCPEMARDVLLCKDSYHIIDTDSGIISGTSGYVSFAITGNLDANPYKKHRSHIRKALLNVVDLVDLNFNEKLFLLIRFSADISTFIFNSCPEFPFEKLVSVTSQLTTPDHYRPLIQEYSQVPDNSNYSIGLVQAMLAFRSDIDSDFNQLLELCWSNVGSEWSKGSIDNIDQQALDQLVEFYSDRKERLNSTYNQRIDGYFTCFMGYFFFRNPYFLEDNISLYLRGLILQINIVKFLFITHPELNAVIQESTDNNDEERLDKTIVEVAYRTARAFEHLNPELLDIMATVLNENGINTPDTIATLIKT